MVSAEARRIVLPVAANLGVGFAFLLSSAHKWRNPDDFALALSRFFPRIPFAVLRPLAYCVIVAESALALAFATNMASGYRQGFAVLLLTAFTAFLLINRAEANASGCACFGDNSKLDRHPVLRNAVLAALAVAPIALGASALTPLQSLLQGAIFAATAGIALLLGFFRTDEPRVAVPAEAGHRPALYVSYRYAEFKDADRLLSEPAAGGLFVVLEAPVWILEAKRAKWSSHRVLASEGRLPGEAPFVVRIDRKGRSRRYGEWAAFLRQYR